MPTHFTIRRIAELHPYRVYSCVSGIRLRLVHPSRARLLLVGHALACQRPLAGAFFPTLWHGYFYGRGAGTLVPRLDHGGNLVSVRLAVFHLAVRIAGHHRDVGDLLQRPAALAAIYAVAVQILFGVALPVEFDGIGGAGSLHSLGSGGRENVARNDGGFVGQLAFRLLAIFQLDDALHQVGVALAEFGSRVDPLGRLHACDRRVFAVAGLAEDAKAGAAPLPREAHALQGDGCSDAAGLLGRRHHRYDREIRPARLLAVAGYRPHAENHFLADPLGGRNFVAGDAAGHRARGNLPGAGGPLVRLELVRRAGAQIEVPRRGDGVGPGGQ